MNPPRADPVDPHALARNARALEAVARGLDPDGDARASMWGTVGDYVGDLAERLAGMPAYSAAPVADPDRLALTDAPGELSDALAVLDDVNEPGINQASGGHMAYIPGGGLFPSALADLVADVSNRYSGVHFASPGANLMERALVRWMADLIGYPESAGGDLTSGGSVANLGAIVTARDAAGIRSRDVERAVVYLTAQAHHCIDKALRIAGLGDCVVRRVPMDRRWRMQPGALADAVTADRAAGLNPWLVVASAGTTNTGSVDPLAALADIADANDLWLHADAAYGGFFVLTDPGRRVLDGLDRSRTCVMDPHKGLFLPFGSGALLVRDVHELAAAHRYSASYLSDVRDAGGVFSPSDLSPELSRPLRAPRLWLPLKVFGIEPFRAALEEKLLLARYFHARLSAEPGWEVGPEPELSVVTYRHVPKQGDANAFNRQLLDAVYADGRSVISGTELDGVYTLRLAVLHYRTHLDEVDGLLDVLVGAARRLAAE